MRWFGACVGVYLRGGQVTRDFVAENDDQLTVNMGDEVRLLDSSLGEFVSVRDALGNVGSVPSSCLRVHL